MDPDGKILEESSYSNRHDEATKFAKDAKAKYVECQAVCESTGNHWIKTADALEKVGIPLELANPFKTKAIAWASIKNDKVDARTLAHLLRSDLVASTLNAKQSANPRETTGSRLPMHWRRLEFHWNLPTRSRPRRLPGRA